MPTPRKPYIFGSVIAATGAAAFALWDRIYPSQRPLKYRIPMYNSSIGTMSMQIPDEASVEPACLNQVEFTKCRIQKSEYETPDTKRIAIECPLSADHFSQGAERKSGDLCFTNIIVREPSGSERKYFPVLQAKNMTDDKENSADSVVSFDVLVERKKMCKTSMHLHAVYPNESIEVKGPFVNQVKDFPTHKVSSEKEKSLWGSFFSTLQKQYHHSEESSRRFFIVSGADGLSQVYSAILQLTSDDCADKRKVDNFLLLSAESVTHVPLMNELGGNLRKQLEAKVPAVEDTRGNFYQYITLSQPRWKWQGGYGKIDRELLKGIVGLKSKNESINRDVMVVVAGSEPFKDDIRKELTDGLNYTPSDMRFLE